MSDSLWHHGLQHARPPCPSPTPRVYPNSCPLSWWCHPAMSSCHRLLLLPSIFPNIKVFSSELVLHIRWPKYWSFSFSISPSNEYSGLISFTIDGFDLLAVQYPIKQDGATNWNVATPEMPSNRINKAELINQPITLKKAFPGGSDGIESTCNVGDLGSIPGLGRSPGGGHGNPLQYSCLENPQGQRSLAGYSPWGSKELDTTEQWRPAQQPLRRASQVALVVKSLPSNAGDIRVSGSIPGSRKSCGGGHGNPLQHSYLENPMDRGAWWDCSSCKKSDTTEAGMQPLRSSGLGSMSGRWS